MMLDSTLNISIELKASSLEPPQGYYTDIEYPCQVLTHMLLYEHKRINCNGSKIRTLCK